MAKAQKPESFPAAVLLAPPKPAVDAEVNGREVVIVLGDRRYRIRGLEKNASFDGMKVNVLVSGPSLGNVGQAMHVDTFDLYQQRPRGSFAQQAATELGVKDEVVKSDLGKILLKLESLQAERIEAQRAAKEKSITLSDVWTPRMR